MLKIFNFLLPRGCATPDSTGCPQAGFILDQRSGTQGPASSPSPTAPVLIDAATFVRFAAEGGRASGLVFVECHPALDGIDLHQFQTAMATQAPFRVALVTGDMDLALTLAKNDPPLAALAIKPCEAAGLACSDAAGVLFDNVRRALPADGPPLVLWGGIATPEAAAAFLATGAAAVVIEQAHWLTDAVNVPQALAAKLAALKPGAATHVHAAPGLSWRLFDKGNSRAVRTLREAAAKAAENQPAHEAAQIMAQQERPLAESAMSPDELIPLGADAPFAASFTRRFGVRTPAALGRFCAEALRLWDEAPRTFRRFLHGPAARELGAGLPVLQGAMSAISDMPSFALAVAQAGGLPTLAVGARSTQQLDQDFSGLAESMHGLPYALNVLVLDENPNRDAQLAWIKTHRPPFVAVAAGDPAFAAALRKDGLEVIYLAADIGLLRLALAAGVRFVVLEGCEAGGHVGRSTALELAQEALLLRRAEPGLFRDARIVLAGGVCGAESALRAAMLGADAVQMGTAYLCTREIIDSGALCPTYQQLILQAGRTATSVTGESVGLRIRSLNTQKTQAIHRLERERAQGGLDESAFRKELETLSLGSLYLAARGRRRGGEALPAEVCEAEGQFMSGAVAANVNVVQTVAELHADIAAGAFRAVPASAGTGPGQSAARERIAITGMSLANSLGHDTDTIIEASLVGKSGIGTVPPERWDHSRHHTPGQVRQGSTYTNVGAFMSIDLPRKALGVSPQDYRTMSQSTRLTLFLARRAIAASGLAGSLVPGSRVAVITSQNSAEVASTMRGQLFNTYATDIGEIAWRAAELSPEQRAALETELRKEGLDVDDTTLIGRLNCTASGHVCNQFGFGGPSYSVGAACAASLIALYNAVLLIRAGVIDAAVVGGGEELLTPAHYLEFSALRALAGVENRQRSPQAHSRPFDRDRDGFVMGEGGAVVVLERESLARERGAPIHAFITGVGACTNHQGIVESVAESQMLALGASYADAGYGLEEVDLVECHGTGTVQGDREEVRALGAMLARKPGSAVLSSFKSQIGHTLGASGISSLIRGIGAMRRGMFPPTNNFENPDPSMGLDASGFRILRRAEVWPRPAQRGRRMQVNAFGFGGACVVVHLESPLEAPDLPFELPPERSSGPVSERPDAASPLARNCVLRLGGRTYRLGLGAADGQGLSPSAAAELAAQGLADGPTPKALARLARKGVFLSPAEADAESAPLALLFSGQGSFYRGMGDELARSCPVVERELSRLAACADFDLRALISTAGEDTLRDTRWQQPALFAFEWALASQLFEHGVQPAAVAGHSLGEYTALAAAGVLSPEDAFRVVDMRARCMAKAAGLAETPTAMAAIGLPLDILQWKLPKFPGVDITNYNTPKQVVVGGPEATVRALVEEIKSKGHQATMLKVSMAFHSPVMRVIRDEFAQFLTQVEFKTPSIPVMSNVHKGLFPAEPEAIRSTMVAHLESPVHWTQNVYYLWSELGVRRFVEVGPEGVLGGLVSDIEPEAEVLRTAGKDREAASFGRALAALYAWGHVMPAQAPEEIVFDLPGNHADAQAGKPSGSLAGRPLHQGQPSQSGTGGANPDGRPDARQHAERADGDTLERTIQIIMDATGYERSEIEPDMDLRQDLAIRSSRLPVIMDKAERAFGLCFRIEDFIGVHTVREMAEHIDALLASGGQGALRQHPSDQNHGEQAAPNQGEPIAGADRPAAPLLSAGLLPVARYEAGEIPLSSSLAAQQENALTGLSGKPAWVLGPARQSDLDAIAAALSQAHSLVPAIGPVHAAPDNAARPACLVIALDGGADGQAVTGADTDALLKDIFRRLKELLQSPARKACVLVLRDAPHGSPARVVFEGALGMVLTLAQEYSSLCWRALRLGPDVDPGASVTKALATPGPVERIVRAGGVSLPQYAPVPLAPACGNGPVLKPGDVVLASGGAKGVTFRLLLALAPLGARFVLLGRSPLGTDEAAAADALRSHGAQAEYLPCDVADRAGVFSAVADVAARLGRVDAVIHGAGLLRDKFLSMMTEDDFDAVCRVKLGGLRNLLDAAQACAPGGLKLAAGFSSVAAWQGNVGQGNYCCANRAMASLLIGLDAPGLSAKVLWLPPVSGVGMADSAEIREMMALKGLDKAYVHIDELAFLAARELACPEASGPSVLIARHMPVAPSVEPLRQPVTEADAGLALPVDGLPMLDNGRLTALAPLQAELHRTVSHERDMWLPEHRPYKALPAPLFSTVMVVESLCEAARALAPQLTPVEVRNLRLLDMLPCPAGLTRDITLRAALTESSAALMLADVELSSEELSPTGRALGRSTTHFEGRVALGAGLRALFPLPGWDSPCALDPGTGLDRPALLDLYEAFTAQTGRYRVMESVLGTGPLCVAGTMRYALSNDCAGQSGPLLTAPYALEGLMQLVLFHALLRQQKAASPPLAQPLAQGLLPVAIGELRLGGLCADGEELALEARLRESGPGMQEWDACARRADGSVALQVLGLIMRAMSAGAGQGARP